MSKQKWTTWRIVKIGINHFETVKDLSVVLRSKGIIVCKTMDTTLEDLFPIFESEEREINLVRVQPADFGFSSGVLLGAFFQRVCECGLVRLPPETGIYSALYNAPISYEERLHMATIPNSGNHGFYVYEHYISCDNQDSGVPLIATSRWAFGIPS